MVFDHSGKRYSISDKNEQGEFVVVKIDMKTRQVASAKTVKASTKDQVKKRIKSNLYEKFTNLPIHSVQAENNVIQ